MSAAAQNDWLTAGEVWARSELAALRAGRFSPPAVARFRAASQRRANATRRAQPELAAQARSWIGIGAIPWVLGLLVARRHRQARASLAWWLACGLMLDWHLGMVETVEGRRRGLSDADALTVLRAWLVPVVWESPTARVCALAGITDALDGPLARCGAPTRAGRDLEGLVDACFTAAALRGARREDLLPAWAAAVESTRILLGIGYALSAYLLETRPPDPTVLRAGRRLSTARTTGLVLAACGRRRAGTAVLVSSALANAARTLRARPNRR